MYNYSNLIKSWYDEYSINNFHIESFNNFICHGIRQVIDSNPIMFTTSKNKTIKIIIDNIYIPKPFIYDEYRRIINITPHDCREKNLTYSSPIYVSVIYYENDKPHYIDRIVLAHIPIMIRSISCSLSKIEKNNECVNDPGGYFIINGIDRVLVSQQRNVYNCIQIFKEKEKDKYKYRLEMRSMSEDTNHSVLVQLFITTNGNNIYINLPFTKNIISIVIVFICLGISKEFIIEKIFNLETNIEIRKKIKYSIEHMFREQKEINSVDDALLFIGSQGTKLININEENVKGYAKQIIDIELFPHLGVFSDTNEKVDLLILMLYKLYSVYYEKISINDRDNLLYKRIENSGILIYELFKSLYRSCVIDLESEYEKNIGIIDVFSKIDNTISKNIKYCFSTGKWGIQRNSYIRQGVSQVMSRLSYISTLSHLQRVIIPVGKEGKNFKIRQIHPSCFGYICLFETPEGQSCGIVLNLTLMTNISIGYNFIDIRRIVMKNIYKYISINSFVSDSYVIMLNGYILGFTIFPEIVVNDLRKLRVQKNLPSEISIGLFRQEKEIHIFCDKGRLLRPFIKLPLTNTIIEQLNTLSFFENVDIGNIQWLDSNEVQSLVISMFPKEKGDFCEIHPSVLFGICSGCIPFSDHNQSPRNVYESSMMKQAIGMFATNYMKRYDAVFHTLNYPQKCLISTNTGRTIGMHDMPAGINCIVAISTYGGWNAEDSIIINKSSIDRGLFLSNTYHTYCFEDKSYKNETFKKICIPDKNIRKPEWNYYHLNNNGLVRKGAYIKRNDVILGQIQISTNYKDGDKTETITDISELSDEEGIIDRVEIINLPNSNRLIKIIIRQLRIPEIGDKFANLAAQKGTCALIVPQEDMPFTEQGIVPDIMMNSHALPSRMTISMLLEMVVGKISLLKGELGDATPFSENSTNITEKLKKILIKYGFDDNGWETMYNGCSGEMFQSNIFIGTSYYQKLKHMVCDKIHARSYGNVTSLTRQPLAGRSKDGGLRLGEMERDCLLSHGSVQFLRERLFNMSDSFSVLICNECNVISNYKDECHICKNNELVRTDIPYAAKLLFQMLNGCLIKTSFSSITM
jgi:DNA-directed RNA polymerase II subunit RPB2